MTEQPKIINSHEAAEILGTSLRTIQRLAHTGEIPVISKGFGKRTEYAFDASVINELAQKEADA